MRHVYTGPIFRKSKMFVTAVKQYLCTELLKHGLSLVVPVFQVPFREHPCDTCLCIDKYRNVSRHVCRHVHVHVFQISLNIFQMLIVHFKVHLKTEMGISPMLVCVCTCLYKRLQVSGRLVCTVFLYAIL